MEELERRDFFVTGNTNIVQSNYLIERKEKLSLPATQLLYTLTGMINKDDEDLKEYKVDVTGFAALWNLDMKLAYQAVADALTELNTKGIREHSINPKTGKKVFTTVNFVSFGRYEHGEGYATIRIEPELKPHYIALQNKFTKYSLNNILQLQENGGQVNAMRTYELLKQFQTIGKRKFTVREYKEQLGLIVYDKKGAIVKEKYKGSNANLKTYVLDLAVEKINSSTDIEVSYTLAGRGDKAIIEFTIKESKNNFAALSDKTVDTVPTAPQEQQKVEPLNTGAESDNNKSAEELRRVIMIERCREIINDKGVSDEEIELIIRALDMCEYGRMLEDSKTKDYRLANYLTYQDIYTQTKQPDNYLPYLVKAIMNNWGDAPLS